VTVLNAVVSNGNILISYESENVLYTDKVSFSMYRYECRRCEHTFKAEGCTKCVRCGFDYVDRLN